MVALELEGGGVNADTAWSAWSKDKDRQSNFNDKLLRLDRKKGADLQVLQQHVVGINLSRSG